MAKYILNHQIPSKIRANCNVFKLISRIISQISPQTKDNAAGGRVCGERRIKSKISVEPQQKTYEHYERKKREDLGFLRMLVHRNCWQSQKTEDKPEWKASIFTIAYKTMTCLHMPSFQEKSFIKKGPLSRSPLEINSGYAKHSKVLEIPNKIFLPEG